jgi:hypothetical protein
VGCALPGPTLLQILRKVFAEIKEIADHSFSQGAAMLGHGSPSFEILKAVVNGSKHFAGLWVCHGVIRS